MIRDNIPRLIGRVKAAAQNDRAWLFVVSIGDYRKTNDIDHSRNSAQLFAQAATKVLGVTPGRRIVLLDDEATSGGIKTEMSRLLRNLADGDHVYFYYSGHGIPVPQEDNEPYILPQDMAPDAVREEEAFRVETIYKRLLGSKAAKVIAFMDSCFTGETDGKSVYGKTMAGTRLAPRKFSVPPDDNLAVLAAGREDQFSGDYPEKGHRMFSYFVIRELLEGKHKHIGDLGDKVSADVTSTTMRLDSGSRQDPVLQGNGSLSL